MILAWIDDLKSRLTGEKNIASSAEDLAMRSLQSLIMITNKERSNTIGITAATHSPTLSVEVANAYADQYLKFRRELKSVETLNASGLLVNQLLEIGNKELAARQAAESFRQAHGLAVVTGAAPGGNSGPTVVGQQLAELNRQLVTASAARAQAEAALQQVQSLVIAGQADKAPQVLTSPIIQKLREMDADLSGREAAAASNLNNASPILDRIKAQIAEPFEHRKRTKSIRWSLALQPRFGVHACGKARCRTSFRRFGVRRTARVATWFGFTSWRSRRRPQEQSIRTCCSNISA